MGRTLRPSPSAAPRTAPTRWRSWWTPFVPSTLRRRPRRWRTSITGRPGGSEARSLVDVIRSLWGPAPGAPPERLPRPTWLRGRPGSRLEETSTGQALIPWIRHDNSRHHFADFCRSRHLGEDPKARAGAHHLPGPVVGCVPGGAGRAPRRG